MHKIFFGVTSYSAWRTCCCVPERENGYLLNEMQWFIDDASLLTAQARLVSVWCIQCCYPIYLYVYSVAYSIWVSLYLFMCKCKKCKIWNMIGCVDESLQYSPARAKLRSLISIWQFDTSARASDFVRCRRLSRSWWRCRRDNRLSGCGNIRGHSGNSWWWRRFFDDDVSRF